MHSRYAAAGRGCVFLIGCNTSSVTSLIMGLATDAPTGQHLAQHPGSNALVTTAMH